MLPLAAQAQSCRTPGSGERKPGGGCLLLRTLPVEGQGDLFLETLSGAEEGTALPRTRVSRCEPQKLQSPSGALVWKEGEFL